MREFDASLWESRAVARRDRALDKGWDPAGAEFELKRNLAAARDLRSTIEWAGKKGIRVFFVRRENGMYRDDLKMVTISNTLSPVNQSIILLHELGHHLVNSSDDERFAKGYPRQWIPSAHHEFDHRLACLEEEIEAWVRGWRLGRRLRLELTRQEFDDMRVKCLRSYVKWTVNPGPRPADDPDPIA